ncbi:MAG: PadR family transcriptional regulator [Streptosporangiaceae bacterium]
MTGKRKVSNLLGLAVLSYLSQQPMHPYALGRALREHGDARSINYNPGSLYMVVQQLARAGFITEQQTGREGQRPERTVYKLTDTGRHELHDWLRSLIEQPRHEYPAFLAALAFVSALPPAEVSALLARRLDLLAGQQAEASGLITESLARGVPGLFLIEEEFRLAQLQTEYGFVRRLIGRIADPAPDWIGRWADHHAQQHP